jgi:hypothetical protein
MYFVIFRNSFSEPVQKLKIILNFVTFTAAKEGKTTNLFFSLLFLFLVWGLG